MMIAKCFPNGTIMFNRTNNFICLVNKYILFLIGLVGLNFWIPYVILKRTF